MNPNICCFSTRVCGEIHKLARVNTKLLPESVAEPALDLFLEYLTVPGWLSKTNWLTMVKLPRSATIMCVDSAERGNRMTGLPALMSRNTLAPRENIQDTWKNQQSSKL